VIGVSDPWPKLDTRVSLFHKSLESKLMTDKCKTIFRHCSEILCKRICNGWRSIYLDTLQLTEFILLYFLTSARDRRRGIVWNSSKKKQCTNSRVTSAYLLRHFQYTLMVKLSPALAPEVFPTYVVLSSADDLRVLNHKPTGAGILI